MTQNADLLEVCEEAAESIRTVADDVDSEQLDQFFFYLGGAIAHHAAAAAKKAKQPGVVDSLLEGFAAFRRNQYKKPEPLLRLVN
jgi:hypothetical protein